MADQGLVQLAGEHRDDIRPGVAAESVAGHAQTLWLRVCSSTS